MIKCQVSKCCCGCSLKLGVILIGVLNLVKFAAGVCLLIDYAQNDNDAISRYAFRTIGDLIATSALGIICLFIGILLIWGAKKDLSKFLWIGMILYAVIIGLQVIIFLDIGIRFLIDGINQKGAVQVCNGILSGVVGGYFVLIINSLRIEIQNSLRGSRAV